MKITLDFGHGGLDPGTVDPTTGLPEKYAAFVTGLTLKHYLTLDGHDVELTRETDIDVPKGERIRSRGAQLFLSVHYDWAEGRPLIYYPGLDPKQGNVTLAATMGAALGIDVRPSTVSPHGRLFIDDYAEGLALIWEVDRLVDFKPDREYRIEKVLAFKDALYDGLEAVALERGFEHLEQSAPL